MIKLIDQITDDCCNNRALAMPLPEPEQPRGQDELERRLPGYRRIVIPRELTLIELLVSWDESGRFKTNCLVPIAYIINFRASYIELLSYHKIILNRRATSSAGQAYLFVITYTYPLVCLQIKISLGRPSKNRQKLQK